MPLPLAIIAVLTHFEPLFTQPTWRKASLLVVGTLLARGRRTVTAALRFTGHAADPRFNRFHHVLNRARWVPLAVSRRLLRLLVATFVPLDSPVEIVVDETLERRWGPQITKRGHYRDPWLSGKGLSVSNSGLRWIIFALVVHVPWTTRHWALPFLAVCATPPEVDAGRSHVQRTVGGSTALMSRQIRRWLRHRTIKYERKTRCSQAGRNHWRKQTTVSAGDYATGLARCRRGSRISWSRQARLGPLRRGKRP
jgi:DDE superfamily endonuclease